MKRSITSVFKHAPSDSVVGRFMKKVRFENACWVWTGRLDDGYGRFRVDGKLGRAHRFSFLWAHGFLTEGLIVNHVCRNRACVNPEHMEEITQRQNILSGIGPTAINARKTHCVHGHSLDNPIIKSGYRHCRECWNKYQLDRYHRLKNQA